MTNFITHFGSALAVVGLSLMSLSCGGKDKDGEGGSKGGGKSLADQVVGYWAPNEAQIDELAKKQIGEDPNAAAMLPMIKALMANMAVEITKDEVAFHGMGEADRSNYKITKTDKDAGTLTMEVTEKDGEPEEGTATIKGDVLTLSKGKDSFSFTRIDKAEFDKRKEAASKPPAGLPPGITPPTTPPGE